MRQLASWEAAGKLLATGGIVLLPTDTMPGLHCRFDRPSAVSRLLELKRRSAHKPFLLLCSGLEEVQDLVVNLDGRVLKVVKHCWPGPFTLILPARQGLPAIATSGGQSVALRVPQPSELRQLPTTAGAPLVSTSANTTGEPPVTEWVEALQQFGDRVDGVLSEAPFWLPVGDNVRPSALVDLTSWPPRVLRAGPLPLPAGLFES
jgi:L-threonylcarbamoyladenylate synthase